MFRQYSVYKRFKKVIIKQPLYKPLNVAHNSLDVGFSESLIDACYLIHKAMIGVLDARYQELVDKVEMDHLGNDNADYISALFLHTYFTQWLNDAKEMHSMTEGGD
jgi:hypothetical protein